MIADFATLTGAARVALGPDMPPFFTDDDALAGELARAGASENDPLWRLPLWRPYEAMLDFKGRRPQQCGNRWLRRLHHGGAVHAPFRQCKILGAFRHLHLDTLSKARAPGRRRVPGSTRDLRDALLALFLSHGRTRSPHKSIPAGDRGGNICKARSRPHVSSRVRAIKSSSRSRRCAACPRIRLGFTRKRCLANV